MASSQSKKRIRLGSPTLDLIDVPDVAAEMRRRGYKVKSGEELEGAWLPSDGVILIRAALRGRARAATILHELLHAAGLDDEREVCRIEEALAPVLLRQGWSP